jgi:hypothetical protein
MVEDGRSGRKPFDSLNRILQMLCVLHGIGGSAYPPLSTNGVSGGCSSLAWVASLRHASSGAVKRAASTVQGEDAIAHGRIQATLKLMIKGYDRDEWMAAGSGSLSMNNLAALGSMGNLSVTRQ